MSRMLLTNRVFVPHSRSGRDVSEQKGILEAAYERTQSLRSNGLATFEFDFTDGELMIAGQVSSYYQKQLIQEAVRSIPGVRLVRNGVIVIYPHVFQEG